jgi:hypothetical protein
MVEAMQGAILQAGRKTKDPMGQKMPSGLIVHQQQV